MTRRKAALAASLAILVGAGGWVGYRVVSQHAIAARHVPAPPALGTSQALIAENLAQAEALARHWWHAADGLAALARLYHANGFYPEAITCYEGLRQLEPRNARWPHLQASILAIFGRTEDALPLARQAVALAPGYIPARLRLGDILLKGNRPAEAAQAYGEVLRQAPDDPYALLGLARCDIMGRDWAAAKARLEHAMERHPNAIGVLSLLVTVSEHFGDTATADSLRATIGRREFSDLPDPWLDDLAEVCFDPYRLSVAAAVASFAGNQANALELLDRAIALAPNAGAYRRQAGVLLLNDRNYEPARSYLEKAVELDPGDADAWLRLVDALHGLGDAPAAATTLLKGLAHCPQSPSLHLEYARWLRDSNRLDEAIGEFRTAVRLRPSEASPFVELATAYLNAGRTDEAMAALQTALERQPDHPTALATLAFLAINANDQAEALRRWERIRRQPKTPPAILANLRQAFRQQFGRDLP